MNTTSTIGRHEELAELGLSQKSMVFKDRRWRVTAVKDEQEKGRNYGLVFHVITSVLLVLTALVVFEFTGLSSGVESIVGKLSLIAVTAYCYLVAFRRGLYSG